MSLGAERPKGLGLAATFTCPKVLGSTLKFWIKGLGLGVEGLRNQGAEGSKVKLKAEVNEAGYNQVLQELLNPQAFSPSTSALNLVLIHFNDWVSEADGLGVKDFLGRVDTLVAALEAYLSKPENPALSLVVCPWHPPGAEEPKNSDGSGAEEPKKADRLGVEEPETTDVVETKGPCNQGPRSDEGLEAKGLGAEGPCTSEGLESEGAGTSAGPVNPGSWQTAFDQGIEALREIAGRHPKIFLSEPKEILRLLGGSEPFDSVANSIGHIPFTDLAFCAIGTIASQAMYQELVPSPKVIVVDCDNTLWAHAVGEVGPEGIEIRQEHRNLQQRLVALEKSGMLICLCSRNETEDVDSVFEIRSEDMVLSRSQIAATQISHSSKVEGLEKLSEELSLNLDSFCFIDDNAAECAQVRAALPSLTVLQFPADQESAVFFSESVWPLAVRSSVRTMEDLGRTQMYQQQEARKAESEELKIRGARVMDLMASLEIQISVQYSLREDLDRISQLIERTNQFNANKPLHIPQPHELLSFEKCGGLILKTELNDKFGSYGVVGAVLLTTTLEADLSRWKDVLESADLQGAEVGCVDIFTMSCRALGRGVEHAMISRIGSEMASNGCRWFGLKFQKKERNQPVHRFLEWVMHQTEGYTAAEGYILHSERAAKIEFDASLPLNMLSGSDSMENGQGHAQHSSGSEEAFTPAQVRAENLWQFHSGDISTPQKLLGRISSEFQLLRGNEPTPAASKVEALGTEADAVAWYHSRRPKKERWMAGQLKAIWEEVLMVENAALNVPFSDYGGDSLSGVSVISRARQKDIFLTLSADFEMLSIDEMVRSAIKDQKSASLGRTVVRGAQITLQEGKQNDASVPKNIAERDCRYPDSAMSTIGGISACANGDFSKAKGLVNKKDWQPKHARDKHGNTALMWACGSGHLQIAQWLVNEYGLEVDSANKEGRTALMWAAKNGNLEVTSWLLDKGIANPSLKMKDGSQAFDWAVYGGHIPTMALLADNPSVDVHALNHFGCGAAFWAAAAGDPETCRWLYARGIDFNLVNQAGHAAVHKAAWRGHRDALKWMLEDPQGPDLRYQLEMPAADGRMPEEKAMVNGFSAIATWLKNMRTCGLNMN